MTWKFPLRNWVGTIPSGQHPGAFAVVRKFHTHEGIDLYCDEGTSVFPVEAGVVSDIKVFTGPEVGSPHWLTTFAVFVSGPSGVVVYGEIIPTKDLVVGAAVFTSDEIGKVTRVLRNDKGKPTTMLHLELRERGHSELFDWLHGSGRPGWLMDPTSSLYGAVR